VKPNGKLPSDFQHSQCRGVVTSVLMPRLGADAPQVVEQVDGITWVRSVTSKATE